MSAAADEEIATLSSEVVYRNRWMSVREDRIRRADGSEGIYGVVDKTDFVVVVPVDEEDGFYLVEQYRYPVRRRCWEFPQGSWETRPDMDPVEVARGELREETGLVAGDMIDAGRLFCAYGFCSQAYRVFLARGLVQRETSLEAEEHGLITRRIGREDLVAMLSDGRIEDATTVAAFGLLQLKGLL